MICVPFERFFRINGLADLAQKAYAKNHKFRLSLTSAKVGYHLFLINTKVRLDPMTERINRFQIIHSRGIKEFDALTKRVEFSDLRSNKYVLK